MLQPVVLVFPYGTPAYFLALRVPKKEHPPTY